MRPRTQPQRPRRVDLRRREHRLPSRRVANPRAPWDARGAMAPVIDVPFEGSADELFERLKAAVEQEQMPTWRGKVRSRYVLERGDRHWLLREGGPLGARLSLAVDASREPRRLEGRFQRRAGLVALLLFAVAVASFEPFVAPVIRHVHVQRYVPMWAQVGPLFLADSGLALMLAGLGWGLVLKLRVDRTMLLAVFRVALDLTTPADFTAPSTPALREVALQGGLPETLSALRQALEARVAPTVKPLGKWFGAPCATIARMPGCWVVMRRAIDARYNQIAGSLILPTLQPRGLPFLRFTGSPHATSILHPTSLILGTSLFMSRKAVSHLTTTLT